MHPLMAMSMGLRIVQLVVLWGPIVIHLVQDLQQRQKQEQPTTTTDTNNNNNIHRYLSNCNDERSEQHGDSYFPLLLSIYAVAGALYGLSSIVLEWKLSQASSIGTPTVPGRRTQKITYLLEVKLLVCPILLFVIWVCGITAVSLAPTYYACTISPSDTTTTTFFQWWWIALAFLLVSQLAELLLSWSFLLHLFQQPPEQPPYYYYDSTQQQQQQQSVALLSTTTQQTRHSLVETTSEDHPSSTTTTVMDTEMGQPHIQSTTTTTPTTTPTTPVTAQNHELVEEMWADRCASACRCVSLASCFVFGGHELHGMVDYSASFGDVARALADYLEGGGVLNVVPSDIAAGFVILQKLQRQRIREARRTLRRLEQQQQQQEGTSNVAVTLSNGSTTDYPTPGLVHSESGGSLANQSSSTDDNDLPETFSDHHHHHHPMTPTLRNRNRNASSTPRAVFRFDSNYNVQRLSRIVLSRHGSDLSVIEEGARYAKYALAIYTWVLYLYVHPTTGLFRLLGHAACDAVGCLCGRPTSRRRRSNWTTLDQTSMDATLHQPPSSSQVLDGDNLCQMHKTALLLTAGLEQSDLVYAQLKSGFNDNPYCILLDHEWRSVVVSIRGTFSLEDCVTDVLINPEPLDQLGQEFGFEGQYCHGGVLSCVRNVYRDLQRHGLLERLLLGESALYPDYTLRLVGHSLGAATCTILSYMLKGTYPSIRVINYSPPGCSLTWDMATKCQDWCLSFVLDSELVPRLSYDAMEHLRDEILDLIGRIKVPKIQVAQRLVNGSERIEDILYEPDEVPESEYKEQMERFKAIQKERREARGPIRSIKLFPPGKMVHLVKVGEKKSCLHGTTKCLTCWTTNAGFEYTPVYINNDDLNEIVVSPTMGNDHFPNRMQFVLEQMAKDFGL